MKAGEIQTKRHVRVRRHNELDPPQFAHVVAHLRDMLGALVNRLTAIRKELANQGGKTVHSMNDDLEFPPFARILLRESRRLEEYAGEIAEMPRASARNLAVPVVVIAEWA